MDICEPERITLPEQDFEVFAAAINHPFALNAALTKAIATAKGVLRAPGCIEAEVVLELAAQCIARLGRLVEATTDVKAAEAFRAERDALIHERFNIDVSEAEQLALLKTSYSRRAGELMVLEEASK